MALFNILSQYLLKVQLSNGASVQSFIMCADKNFQFTIFYLYRFLYNSPVPQVSREGDPFVSTSLEEAIRSINSAIDSTRRQLFDGWALGAAGKTCQENNSFCCESQCHNPSGIYWDHLCLGQGLVTAVWFLIYHCKGTLCSELDVRGWFCLSRPVPAQVSSLRVFVFHNWRGLLQDKCFWMKSLMERCYHSKERLPKIRFRSTKLMSFFLTWLF